MKLCAGQDETATQFSANIGRQKNLLKILPIIQKCCYHHDGTPKRQLLCVDIVARQASGQAPGSILAQNLRLFTLHPYNHHFLSSDEINLI